MGPEFVIGSDFEFLEGALFIANRVRLHFPLDGIIEVGFEDFREPVVVPSPFGEADAGDEGVISPDFVPGDGVVKFGFELVVGDGSAEVKDGDAREEGFQ